jgi:hypothetical protein
MNARAWTFGLLMVVAGAPAHAQSPPALDESVSGWCADLRVSDVMFPERSRWCAVAAQSECPNLARACAGPLDPAAEAAAEEALAELLAREAEEQSNEWQTRRARERAQTPEGGLLPRLAFWALVVGFALVLAREIIKLVRQGGGDAAPATPKAATPDAEAAPAPAAAVTQRGPLPAARIALAEANRAAESRDWGRSVQYLALTLQSVASARGLIAWRPSLTPRDYLRAFNGQPEAGVVRRVFMAAQGARFGARAPEREQVTELLQAVTRLVEAA